MACCTAHKRKRLLKQIKGFLRSMFLNIKSGFKNVSHKEYIERYNICKGCWHFDRKKIKCKDCGCYIKVKARLKIEDCPQGYWRKLDEHTN